MDIWKFYAVTHADHVMCDPISSERIDELIGLLDLAPSAHVWEAAPGKGEFLIRLAERYGVQGTAVDTSPHELAIARSRAALRIRNRALVFVEGDAAEHPPTRTVDLAVCLGATWIWGGLAGTLAALRSFVRPGGLVLVGEPFWKHEPSSDYLEFTGRTADEFSTLDGNVEIAKEAGLTIEYAMPSRDDEWDRYEFLQLRAAERYAREHPDDPDVPEILDRIRHSNEAYRRWGRDTMGWSIYLFRAPG
jgi:SAM-dependent methyltransferase